MSKLRSLSLAAAAGGVAWIVFAAAGLLSTQRYEERVVLDGAGDYLGFGLFALCLALAVPALVALHLHHRGADRRLGRAGTLIASAGAGGQCVVISAIVVNGAEPAWFGVAAPAAILTWVVGSVVLGIAVRRARVMPGWVGIALPIATMFAIVGSDAGSSVIIGAFQLVVGLRIARAEALGASPDAANPAVPAAAV